MNVVYTYFGKEFDKPNLKGDRRFSRYDLGDDDRRSGRNKSPRETFGETANVRVFTTGELTTAGRCYY